MGVRSYLPGTARRVRVCAAALTAACALVFTAGVPGQALADQGGSALSARQRLVLHGIAADTWKFYAADVDPNTNLPLDNLGPGAVRATYTSAANIGVYLWAVVAARDLGLIDRRRAHSLTTATLEEGPLTTPRSSPRSVVHRFHDSGRGVSGGDDWAGHPQRVAMGAAMIPSESP